MATLTEQAYNALVYDLIDAMITANPSGVQKELQANNFQFTYGQNSQLAQNYLHQIYHNNPDLFWQIVRNVKVNKMNVPPVQRERLDTIATVNGSTAKTLEEWWQDIVSRVQGSKTEGGSTEESTQTTTGAYVVYALLIIAVIGIAVYLIRIVK